MGMGLSMCRSIIENYVGKIWVSSGVSRGSIFQFELPQNPRQLWVAGWAPVAHGCWSSPA